MNDLIVTPLEDGRHWKLKKAFKYDTIVVPKGFITDFTSVPRFFWRIFPPWGKYGKCSVVHDYCYFKQLYSRQICDKVFLECMKDYRVSGWRRNIIYWAVRTFGWIGWNEYRKEDK